MPTLEDVARRAGVSTATVSKVLSNTPYFTPATREKVMQAVRELGYVPNLAARALAAGKTRIVAVVFPYVYDAIFTDPLIMLILQGIEAESTQHGYNLLLSTPRLSPHARDESYVQLIQSGYVDGIIAIDNHPSISAVEPAQKRGIPAVAIGYHPSQYYVRSADQSGGFQLMQHVLDLGHRQIGIISVPEEMHLSIHHRVIGLRKAAELSGLDFDAIPEMDGDFSTPSGAACAAQLLTDYPDLTALVCLNDRMALGAIQQAREMGRRVPHDLTVVGYDDIPSAAVFSPALTTIDQQAPELGRVAARMLFDVLAGNEPTPVEVPTQLVIRQSSAPRP